MTCQDCWSPEIDCIWSSVSNERSSFSGMPALFSHFVSYPPGYSSLENCEIKKSALNSSLNSMELKKAYLEEVVFLIFHNCCYSPQSSSPIKNRHKNLEMSGDATEKPHFYNDKVHAGEQTREKWSEIK